MFDMQPDTLEEFGLAPLPDIPANPVLNPGQAEACEAFFEFLFQDCPEMGISGPGGVGKSFTMCQMIDTIMPRYFDTCKMMGVDPVYTEVVMTATTNKAAEILATGTKRPTSTVHSFMNLKVQDDYDTGVSKIAKTGAWKVHEKKIIFIDECSMIDTPLDRAIQEGTQNCKIVYVGDHCQLAPVMESISPIYRRNIPFYVLTQQMRNNNQPALMHICEQLRHTVETGEFSPIQIVPGVIDLLDGPSMEAAIDQEFLDPETKNRILAYTNRRVVDYNDHIRTVRNQAPEYGVGEKLISNSAFKVPARMISVEEEVSILSASPKTEMIWLEKGVEMEIRRVTLQGQYGDSFREIPLPVDRDHYVALTKHYARAKKWATYFRLKQEFPDLRPRDAATTYKAQGSTYEDVFIDLGDISTCTKADQAARLMYVAFSRARSRVFLYGELAPKYGGYAL